MLGPATSFRRGAIAAIALALWPLHGAFAQDWSALQNKSVAIAYVAPNDPALRQIYAGLAHRQVLEELSQFLAPLQLPKPLTVRTMQCGKDDSDYDPDTRVVRICYESVATIIRLAPEDVSPDGFSREDAIVGAFVEIVLHDVALAVIDELDAPVFGRAGDAADQLAAFIMLQFGRDTARRTVAGAAYFFQTQKLHDKPTDADFAADTDIAAQRFYNYLCIAYGGAPDVFQLFVDKKLLPQARAARCAHEFQQIRYAFAQTIYPSIDPKLLDLVRSRQWLLPTDGK